ncbi:hypothetical protein AB6D11_18705 [Vibrio splendidus]
MTTSADIANHHAQDELFRLYHIALAKKGLSHPKRWTEGQQVALMKALSTDDLVDRYPHWAGITIGQEEQGMSLHILMDRTVLTLTPDGLTKGSTVSEAEWDELLGALLRWLETQSALPVPSENLKTNTVLYAHLVSAVIARAPVSEGSMHYGHQWVMETIANRLLAPEPLACSEHPDREHAAAFNDVLITKGIIPYYPALEKCALELTREALSSIDAAQPRANIDRFNLGVWIQSAV